MFFAEVTNPLNEPIPAHKAIRLSLKKPEQTRLFFSQLYTPTTECFPEKILSLEKFINKFLFIQTRSFLFTSSACVRTITSALVYSFSRSFPAGKQCQL